MIDADVFFRDPNWASEAVHSLQQYHVIQPWTHAYDLGPNGEHLDVHRSIGSMWMDGKPIVQGPNAKSNGYQFGHPGFAWIWRRSALDAVGGMPETAALGAADHHAALAILGRVDELIPGNMTPGYVAPLRLWQHRAEVLQKKLGATKGTIEHRWHGKKIARGYVSRWDVLVKHRFDPFLDLVRNATGLLQLAPGKIGLRQDIERYFVSRDEDQNSMA